MWNVDGIPGDCIEVYEKCHTIQTDSVVSTVYSQGTPNMVQCHL